jgi:hypothetical protein
MPERDLWEIGLSMEEELYESGVFHWFSLYLFPKKIKYLSICIFFFLWYWVWTKGLHLESLHHFCNGVFRDRVSWTICQGWFQIVILLISASWVARITGVSHTVTIIINSLSPKGAFWI